MIVDGQFTAKTTTKTSSATARIQIAIFGPDALRAIVAIACFLAIWELGSRSQQWLGVSVPWLGKVPAPTTTIDAWWHLLADPGYWKGWYLSTMRVLGGFGTAILIGIPFGLWLALSKTFYGTAFPPFEVLRPIPPLAWVPASIIFWPTQELSIGFITFLGAFFPVVINVVEGAKSIDIRYYQAARSMGASRWDIFRRIILPGTLPSITVGAAVGMGITWEVVVAAEMISGGGSSLGGSGAAGGLGFFLWSSYIAGSYERIVVGMISIGVAGYICSSAVRALGEMLTPWLKTR